MLVHGGSSLFIAKEYVDFMHYLVQATWVFNGAYGFSKSQYRQAIDSLHESYKYLVPIHRFPPFERLVNRIATILNRTPSPRLGGLIKPKPDDLAWNDQSEISELLWTFLKQEEPQFREFFFDALLAQQEVRQLNGSHELHRQTVSLLNAGNYDNAVFASFKYLDNHLQKILRVSPTEYYGEELINYAFAPNTGKLQLNTHPNEQVGLRNFVSGANALFRNPSAHRFVEYDQSTASILIALTALIAKLADQLTAENKRRSKRKKTAKKAE